MKTKFLNVLALFVLGYMLSIVNIYAEIQYVKFPREGMISRLERINELGKTTWQVVTYNKTAIANNERLPEFTARTNNMEEWLHESLKNTEWTYRKIRDNYFSVLVKEKELIPETVSQEQRKGIISGKIVDEQGLALPGATIKVSGQSIGTATDINGNFRLSLPVGTYTIEVGYIGYQTQQITGVTIKNGGNTPLDIALNTESTSLSEVVVTASYNKATTGGLLRLQQNASGVTSGLSSQQISALPDKNVGEALKRISGVSTIDNKKVVVRGIAERYNVAQLDGVTLPSTDVQERSFDFNIIQVTWWTISLLPKVILPIWALGLEGGWYKSVPLPSPMRIFSMFLLV